MDLNRLRLAPGRVLAIGLVLAIPMTGSATEPPQQRPAAANPTGQVSPALGPFGTSSASQSGSEHVDKSQMRMRPWISRAHGFA